MKEEIYISKKIYDQMIEHGRNTLPYEACGLLSGNNNYICSWWPLWNEAQSTKRFYVSKDVVEHTIRDIDLQNEHVIAIYHTHPLTKPIPSKYDILHHIDEAVKMVIISYRTILPIAKCYSISKATYEECLFSIVP